MSDSSDEGSYYSSEESVDPWGDTPTWERSISNDDNDETNNNGNIVSQDAHAYAARHTLVLIDTHPSMFEPCIRICNDDSDDEDSDSDNDSNGNRQRGKDEKNVHDDCSSSSSTTEEGNDEYDTKKKSSSTSSSSKTLLTKPFDASLMAVERLLHHKVRTVAMSKLGKRDGVGVILYGTPPECIKKNHKEIDEGNDEDDDDYENNEDDDDNQVVEKNANESLKELIKLTPPGVDQIKTIRSCLPPEFYHSNRSSDHVGSYHHQGGDTKYKNNNTKSPTNALIRDMNYERDGSQSRWNGGRERDLYIELFGKGDSNEDSESDLEEDEEQEKTDCSLRHALNEATRTFANAKCVKKAPSTATIEKIDAKTIWIFTNQDNPIPSSIANHDNVRNMLYTAVNDVFDNGQEIHLWPLPNKTRKMFDKSLFYNEILDDDEYDRDDTRLHVEEGTPVSIDDNDAYNGIVHVDLEDLLETIGRRWKKVRKSQSIPLLLPDWNLEGQKEKVKNGDDKVDNLMDVDEDHNKSNTNDDDGDYPGIMMDLYPTIRKKGKPKEITIDSRSKKRTNKVTQHYSKETGEIVSKERIRTFTEFGGQHVLISKEEVAELKKRSNGNPNRASLILLGFKPMPSVYEAMSLLPMVDKSIFAYPNDYQIKGSKKAFATLHASMLRKNVMGVGELLLRVTAVSRLVAIVPQEEERHVEHVGDDEEIFKQLAPPGFLLIPLAFQDDMREMPNNPDFAPEKDLIDAAIELIKHQNIEESIEIGSSFENPVLKMFWNYIESVALGTPLDEFNEGDDTVMNVDGILEVAGPKIDAFVTKIPKDDIETQVTKKRKSPKIVPDQTGIDWNDEYINDTFYELRVDELKAYLRSNGLKLSGRKDEIIERIKNHMDEMNDNTNEK